jgi:glycerophosphoryl diester phosphodiesterase
MRTLRNASPSLATGYDADCRDGLYSGWDLCRQALLSGASFMAHPWQSLTADIVGEAHRHGLGVWVWTVDDEPAWLKMLEWRVDGVMTNRPDVLRQFLTNEAHRFMAGYGDE